MDDDDFFDDDDYNEIEESEIEAVYRAIAEGNRIEALDLMRKIFPHFELLPPESAIRLYGSILKPREPSVQEISDV